MNHVRDVVQYVFVHGFRTEFNFGLAAERPGLFEHGNNKRTLIVNISSTTVQSPISIVRKVATKE